MATVSYRLPKVSLFVTNFCKKGSEDMDKLGQFREVGTVGKIPTSLIIMRDTKITTKRYLSFAIFGFSQNLT
jgi:hypothetical protein